MTARPSAVIVGGGFYGCSIATHLAAMDWQVALLEQEKALMTQASFMNQARLHNGYHYPRSFRTAIRSRANLGAFRETYAAAVHADFKALYAVASVDSKINAAHFERFCRAAGIPLRPASKADRGLFNPRLVQAVYEAEEPAFDAAILRALLADQLATHGVTVRTNTTVTAVDSKAGAGKELLLRTAEGETLAADWVFNCTYASLNHVDGRQGAERPPLRHQIAEIVLVEPPEALAGLGVTVMDGPFFSVMPFPPKDQHSLTHVRYTHHMNWTEGGEERAPAFRRDPRDVLADYLETGGGPAGRSRADWMLRDARRYLPVLAEAKPTESLFCVKSLVINTLIDDARPIYFHRDRKMPGFISILGGKIDNIFDVLGYIDTMLEQSGTTASAGSPIALGGQ